MTTEPPRNYRSDPLTGDDVETVHCAHCERVIYLDLGGNWRHETGPIICTFGTDASPGPSSAATPVEPELAKDSKAADHPYFDPGDGRQECEVCGKWVWPVTHSCKGVPVTTAALKRLEARRAATPVGQAAAPVVRKEPEA